MYRCVWGLPFAYGGRLRGSAGFLERCGYLRGLSTWGEGTPWAAGNGGMGSGLMVSQPMRAGRGEVWIFNGDL